MSMMSSEPQPRRTAEKRRFSNTAVQAIHQRRRWAVARVGAMVRCGGGRAPGSADTCAQTSASEVASAAALPNPCGRWSTATSLSAPCSPGYRCTPPKKRTLALSGTWATPNPQLPGTSTLGHSRAPLAKRKGFSLSSLGGKLRHGSWKRANVYSRTWSWS